MGGHQPLMAKDTVLLHSVAVKIPCNVEEERVCLAYTRNLQSFPEESEGRHSSRNLEQTPERNTGSLSGSHLRGLFE